jgi:uncharacterized protein
MDQSLKISILEKEFLFDYRRAIFWPERKILLVADLHWGKTQYLRNHGVAIGDSVFHADLQRLSALLIDYEVETLLVLGDLIHHEQALSSGVIEKIAHFRDHHPCELILLKGNHDRYTTFPPSWGIVEENDFILDRILFTHEFRDQYAGYQFCGHVHPMIRLKSSFDKLRLPAFVLTESSCLLPAFSHLTGGQDVKIGKKDKAIVLWDEGLSLFEK